ncbi:hypothetical protein SM124_09015 [Bacillus sp. 31A1R]|uniref:Uncharacterized protein n=1 Tax=Robertmurraya mangrovi TaxID=3098077 RepID=A0ABU5IXJ3_9BACI|nr:hypothetical protein [Bacillus sp. 31A1R]MDZ5471888.1 hypothetical protein [Bacillus sp. 31A1R]
MGLISGKVASVLVAGSLATGVATYTGTQHLDTIKEFGTTLQGQVETLSDKLNLANDNIVLAENEAYRNIQSANKIIKNKNERINNLESQVQQANADIESLKTALAANAAAVEGKEEAEVKVANIAAVTDEQASNNLELTIGVQQNLDTADSRTIAVSNPNMIDVVVTYTSNKGQTGTLTVPAGDTLYVKKDNSGEMVTFTYTLGEKNYSSHK